jgi:hypothetical protein
MMLVLVGFGGLLMAISPASADGVESSLTPGVSEGGSLSATSQSDKYSVTIDDGYDSLTIQMDESVSGYDFDLYLRYQYWPTTSEYDVRGYTSPPSETCTIDNPAGGSYGIMVYSYSGGGSYTIKATLTGGSSTTTLILDTPLTGQSLAATGAEKLYSCDVSSTYASLTIRTYDTGAGYDFWDILRAGTVIQRRRQLFNIRDCDRRRRHHCPHNIIYSCQLDNHVQCQYLMGD